MGESHSFLHFLPSPGLRLGESFKALDASGEAHNFTLTFTQPLIRSRWMIFNFSLGGEGKILDDRTGSAGLKKQRHTEAGQAGISGVRAFPVSEGFSNKGFVGTAELRYLFGKLGPLPGSLQFAAFVDHGYANLRVNPLDPEENTRNLTGVGFGVSWFDEGGFNIRTSVAWRTAGDATGKSELEETTVYFQMVKRF